MNLVTECPDISDGWKGGVGKVAEVLGLSRITISRAADKGRRNGGIDWIPGRNGRRMFTGKEVKRFWRSY